MCHNYAKHFLTSVLLLAAISPAVAQLTTGENYSKANNENAPYSRYGIGEERNGVNTLIRQMGSISTAYANPFAVNTDNPASYSALRLTTYEAGGEGSIRSATAGGESYTTGMATLSYLTVGVPVGKKGGLALGLKPYARTRYLLEDTMVVPGIGVVNESYLGDGSLQYAFLGGGYNLNGFSFGFNFGYMFGTIDNSNSIIGDSLRTYGTVVGRRDKIGGVYWKGGLQYETPLNTKLRLRLGATATLSQGLDIQRNEAWFSYYPAASNVDNKDTVYSVKDLRSEIILPSSYTFGIQLVSEKNWMVGADLNLTQWNKFRKFGLTDSVADNTYRIAVGGEYTPDPAAMRNYLQRITYRLGFYYGQDYVRLRNTDMNYFAVTGGVSLPFKRTTDRIHLSLEVGSRGTETNGLIKETFARFGVGLTLNDKWFIKRKYD